MGRSRGGLTSKIHALVDAEGRPIDIVLTPGQCHDGKAAPDLLEALEKDAIVLADKAYDSDAIRKRIEDKGAWANINATGRRPSHSPSGSTDTATWSSASSTNSNSSEASRHDTTKNPKTSSPP